MILILNNELPPKLPTEQQIALLKELPDLEARNAIWEGNLRLVLYIAKKFSNTSYPMEDLFAIGCIGLGKAIDTFCIDKNTAFATYAGRCIENEILMYIRKESKYSRNCSLNQPLSVDWDGNQLLLEDIVEDAHSAIELKAIEDKEKITSELTNALNYLYRKSFLEFLVYLYTLGKKKQKEISGFIGLSQSYVSRLLKKALRDAVLSQKTTYSLKSNSANLMFFYKENLLYIGISKNLFIVDCSKFFDEGDKDYFFISLPDYEESFSDLADMFRLLKENCFII